MSVQLLKNQYSNPRIIQAVCQVLLNWTDEDRSKFCASIKHEALDEFKGVTEVQNMQLNISIHTPGVSGPAPTPENVATKSLQITVDDQSSAIFIDSVGFRVGLQGPYKGRDYLFSLVNWVTSRLPEHIECARVSILFQCLIVPDLTDTVEEGIGPIFEATDYVIPYVEFSDDRLNMHNAFSYSISMIFNRFGDDFKFLRGKLDLSLRVLPLNGIVVSIDILDEETTDVSKVLNRLAKVKDMENHVFESTITEKTRKQFGLIEAN